MATLTDAYINQLINNANGVQKVKNKWVTTGVPIETNVQRLPTSSELLSAYQAQQAQVQAQNDFNNMIANTQVSAEQVAQTQADYNAWLQAQAPQQVTQPTSNVKSTTSSQKSTNTDALKAEIAKLYETNHRVRDVVAQNAKEGLGANYLPSLFDNEKSDEKTTQRQEGVDQVDLSKYLNGYDSKSTVTPNSEQTISDWLYQQNQKSEQQAKADKAKDAGILETLASNATNYLTSAAAGIGSLMESNANKNSRTVDISSLQNETAIPEAQEDNTGLLNKVSSYLDRELAGAGKLFSGKRDAVDTTKNAAERIADYESRPSSITSEEMYDIRDIYNSYIAQGKENGYTENDLAQLERIKALLESVDTTFRRTNEYSQYDDIAEAEAEEHPIAAMVGEMVPMTALNLATSGALTGGNTLAGLTGKEFLKTAATNAAKELPVDLVSDTIPHVLQDVADNKSDSEVTKNALTNAGANYLFNLGLGVGGEMLGRGIKALKNNKNNLVDVARNINLDDALKEVGRDATIDELQIASDVARENVDELSDVAKSVLPEADDVAKNIEPLPNATDIPGLSGNVNIKSQAQELAEATERGKYAMSVFNTLQHEGDMSDDMWVKAIKVGDDFENGSITKEEFDAGIKAITDSYNNLTPNDASRTIRDLNLISNELRAFEQKYPDADMTRVNKAFAEYEEAIKTTDPDKIDAAISEFRKARYQVDAQMKKALGDEYGGEMHRGMLTNKNSDNVGKWVKQAQETPDEIAGLIEELESGLEKNRYAIPANQTEDVVSNARRVMAEDAGLNGSNTEEIATLTQRLPEYGIGGKTYDSSVDIDLPNVNEEAKAIERYSDVRTNTLTNSDVIDDVNKTFGENEMKYMTTTEAQSLNEATQTVVNDIEGATKKYTTDFATDKHAKDLYGAQDADTMMILISKYNKMAREATDPALAKEYAQKAHDISINLYKTANRGGSFNQALAKWTRTADGTIKSARIRIYGKVDEYFENNPNLRKSIGQVQEDIENFLGSMDSEAATREQIEQMITDAIRKHSNLKNRITKADIQTLTDAVMNDKQYADVQNILEFLSTGYSDVSPETMQKVQDIFDSIEELPFNSKARVKAEQQAYSMLANEMSVGGTFAEKLDSWRYLSMLANPTTDIKNVTGNIMFGQGMVSLKNSLASTMESAVDAISKATGHGGIERTKSILTSADKDLIEACKEDALTNAYRELSGNKYYSASSDLEKAMPTYNPNTKFGKALNWASETRSKTLSAEDEVAKIAKYKTSLAGYLKANGKSADILDSADPSDIEFMELARSYAINQAEEATFQQKNTTATAITRFVKDLRTSDSSAARALGLGVDIVVPFKKTPANILKSAIEYSPLQLIKLITDIPKVKGGSMSAAEMIDDVSKGLTGTAALGFGAFLASNGIITSGYTDDDRTTAYKKNLGKGKTAIHIGGMPFSLDEFSPTATPIILGSAIYETIKEKGADPDALVDVLLSTATTSLNAISDMTMLSGLADILTSIRYSETDSDVMKDLALTVGGNLAGQFLPTVGGRIEKIADDTTRTTYSGNNSMTLRKMEQTKNYLTQKIPGLQALGEKLETSDNSVISSIGDFLTNEPAIDQWGNEKKNFGSNVAGRAAYNLLSPTQIGIDSSDETDNKLLELAKATGDSSVIPYTTTQEAKVNGQRMSEEQWTEYQKKKGQLSKELVDSFYSNADNEALSNEDQAEIIKEFYNFAKAKYQSEIAGATLSSSNEKLNTLYEEGGAEAVIDYIKTKKDINDLGLSVNDTNLKLYEEGGIEAVQANEEQKQTIDSYGLSVNDTTKEIYQTQGEAGLKAYAEETDAITKYGLTVNDTTKEIYSSDGSQGLVAYSALKNTSLGASKSTYESYKKAASVIPGLSAKTFAVTYNNIDSDNNNSIKQQEIVDYVNNNNLSDEEVQQIVSAYGAEWTKVLKKQSDGTWKFVEVK